MLRKLAVAISLLIAVSAPAWATAVTGLNSNTSPGGLDYETVAASQTGQVFGATGASGDYIEGVLVIPTTLGAGSVTLLDGGTSIVVYNTGTLVDLKPFFIPLGLKSVAGAWKLTTGTNVAAIGIGKFK